MRQIEWGLQASFDLENIADHYGSIVPDLAEKMIRRIEKAALPLIDYPGLGVSAGHLGLRSGGRQTRRFFCYTRSLVTLCS